MTSVCWCAFHNRKNMWINVWSKNKSRHRAAAPIHTSRESEANYKPTKYKIIINKLKSGDPKRGDSLMAMKYDAVLQLHTTQWHSPNSGDSNKPFRDSSLNWITPKPEHNRRCESNKTSNADGDNGAVRRAQGPCDLIGFYFYRKHRSDDRSEHDVLIKIQLTLSLLLFSLEVLTPFCGGWSIFAELFGKFLLVVVVAECSFVEWGSLFFCLLCCLN